MSIYLEQDAVLYRLHPVTKIISLGCLLALSFTFNHPLYLIPLGLGIIGIGWAGKSLNNIRRIWPFLIGLIILIAVLIFISGIRLTTIRREAFSGPSLLYGLGMGIRLNMIILSGLFFLSTTKVEEFIFGLNKLRIPSKLILPLSLAFRLIPIFVDSGATVVAAQQARGLDLESGGLIRRMKAYLGLIIPIFLSGLQKTKYLAIALQSKGFGARGKRTFYLDFKISRADVISLGVLISLNLVCLWLRFQGYGIIH
ncbi:MAG: energy-coupling factor transporter transmembrane component T [bacterium]